jgi:ElaB/YqjD/DUF883 family membrane-anchored ribosome-binding protein
MPTKSNASNTDSDAVKELRSLIAEAEKAIASAGEQGGEEIEKLGHRFKDAIAHGREVGDRAVKAVREHAVQADEFVHDRPYIAIGIAAGLGLIAGALVSRRCNS